MNKLYRLLAFTFALQVILLVSCSDENSLSPEIPENESTETTVPEYSVAEVRSYDRRGLFDHAIEPYVSKVSPLTLNAMKAILGYSVEDALTYKEVVLHYQSIDHTGSRALLSGVLCYPVSDVSPLAIEQLVAISHGTITDNASCPSAASDALTLLTLSGSTAVVLADYQGYGVSRAMIHPYLNEELTARQSIDLLKAASDYLSKDISGVSVATGIVSYSVGYSQGGSAALAVHKMLECKEAEFAETIGFGGSVCGGGPYNIANTLSAYHEQGFVAMPIVLPMILRSMIVSHPEVFNGLTLEDFFTDEFLATGGGLMALIDAKELNTSQFNSLFDATGSKGGIFPLEDILRQEVFTVGSPQQKAIAAASDIHDCIKGWVPTKPVGFFHSEYDTIVPFANLQDIDQWPEYIYTIQYPSKQEADHLESAILFYLQLLQKGPASMLPQERQ